MHRRIGIAPVMRLHQHRGHNLSPAPRRSEELPPVAHAPDAKRSRRGRVPRVMLGGLRRRQFHGPVVLALRRSTICGHVRGAHSGSCALPWWTCARENRDAACARDSRVERCVSSLRLRFLWRPCVNRGPPDMYQAPVHRRECFISQTRSPRNAAKSMVVWFHDVTNAQPRWFLAPRRITRHHPSVRAVAFGGTWVHLERNRNQTGKDPDG